MERFLAVIDGRLRMSWLVLPLWASLQVFSTAQGAAPVRVRFDVVRVVACRDVTTAEFAAANPQKKLVRAVFEVSALVQGDESRLRENHYQFTLPHRRMQVADYEPRTVSVSQYAGNIGVERQRESTKNATLAMTGGWKYLAQITGGGDVGAKDNTTMRYELLPPLESVAASGTLQRGGAVYFKLKRIPQALLEGSKQFAITFCVSPSWRADCLHIRCSATSAPESNLLSRSAELPCGEANFVVALHLAGDEEAARVATEFMDAALALGQVALQNRQEIRRQSYPTVFHEFGALIGAFEPKLDENWLSDILYQSPENRLQQITRQLPADVRLAANQYLAARDALRSLDPDGGPSSTH
jgi:hypothetical protein